MTTLQIPVRRLQMSLEHRRKSVHILLDLSAGLGILAAGVAGTAHMQPGPEQWLAAVLVALYGWLYWAGTTAGERAQTGRVHACIALQTLLVLGLCLLDPESSSAATYFSILFFIMSALVMLFVPQRAAILWIVVFTLVSAAAMVCMQGIGEGLRSSLPNVAGYFFFAAFANSLKHAQAAQAQSAHLLDELRAAHTRLQEYADQVERLAVAEERNRLAREMHDAIGHRLTVASVQLEGIQRLIDRDPERARRMAGTVHEQVRAALGELRRTVAALREPPETDLPLPQALQKLAFSFMEATGLNVHLALPEATPTLPAAHRLALYRAAQEGLTNIQRHAQAQDAWLELGCPEGCIQLLVGDNGVGFAPLAAGQGFGLRGLHERAAQLGGELCVETRPGGGVQLKTVLPLPDRAEREDG